MQFNVSVIKQRWWVVPLGFAFTVILAGLGASVSSPTYTATVVVLVDDRYATGGLAAAFLGPAGYGIVEEVRLVRTRNEEGLVTVEVAGRTREGTDKSMEQSVEHLRMGVASLQPDYAGQYQETMLLYRQLQGTIGIDAGEFLLRAAENLRILERDRGTAVRLVSIRKGVETNRGALGIAGALAGILVLAGCTWWLGMWRVSEAAE